MSVKGGYEAHRGPSLFSLFAVLPQGGDVGALLGRYAEALRNLSDAGIG